MYSILVKKYSIDKNRHWCSGIVGFVFVVMRLECKEIKLNPPQSHYLLIHFRIIASCHACPLATEAYIFLYSNVWYYSIVHSKNM